MALFLGLVFLLTQESKTGSPDGSADHYANSNPQPNIAGQCPDNGTHHYAKTDADADCFYITFGFSTWALANSVSAPLQKNGANSLDAFP